jgi:undecaprenyl diphosphate synthase
MQIFIDYLQKMKLKLVDQPIKVKILWDTSVFSDTLKQAIQEIEESTKNHTTYQFNLCLNYWGRSDILQGIKSLYQDIQQEKHHIESINEAIFENYLSTAGQPDPDLIIRTSGEERLSNFLTRQSAYSELLFINTLRPDFNEDVLETCLTEFSTRKRRYGK